MSAPNSSHTDMSKLAEWNRDQTSCGPNPNQRSVAANSRVMLAWLTCTPLGLPVDPEV